MSARVRQFSELTPEQQLAAVRTLNDRAEVKARDGGALMPHGWAERVAAVLRYGLTRSGAIWDCIAPEGKSIFDLSLSNRQSPANFHRPARQAA